MGPFISGIVDNHEAAAAETGCGLIHDSEGKTGSNGGIDSVAAAIENLCSGLGRQRVVRNDQTRATLLGVARKRRDKEEYEKEEFRLKLAREEHKEDRFTLCLNLRRLFCNLKIFARSGGYVTFDPRIE